ncbi:MAG: pilus assembly protein PilM [Planctomycetaceae bacterium]|nr:pilus assembly protein PilM [Planctomycetaceae bacterium]
MARRTRKNTVLGLDVGSRSVKAVEMTRTGETLQVTSCSYEEVEQPGAHTASIQAVLKAGSHDVSRVAVGFSGRRAFLRVVSLAGDAVEDVGEAVFAELAKYIPYDIDDARIGYQILPGQHDRFLRVLATAARRDDIARRLTQFHEAGIQPVRMDMELAALANAFETANIGGTIAPAGRGVCMVDFGATKTLIAITDGSRCVFREFPFGGDKLSEMLAHRLGCEVAEAETIKRHPGDRIEMVKDAIYPGIEDIAAEVRSCQEAFVEISDGVRPDLLLASGGLVAFPGVTALFGRLTRCAASPFHFGAVDTSELDTRFLEDHGHEFAVAFGLACHARGDGI